MNFPKKLNIISLKVRPSADGKYPAIPGIPAIYSTGSQLKMFGEQLTSAHNANWTNAHKMVI